MSLTIYGIPASRAVRPLWAATELGLNYHHEKLAYQGGGTRTPEFLAINPLGKLPTLVHGDAVVTEQVAITIYLADRFPEAGLAPAFDHPLRGPYLRWMAFYGACFEPAMIDKAMHREPPPRLMSPYNDAETVLQVVEAQLAQGPYLLGEVMSAADVLWGNALAWTTAFGLVQPAPATADYIARMSAMTAFDRSRQIDAELAAA